MLSRRSLVKNSGAAMMAAKSLVFAAPAAAATATGPTALPVRDQFVTPQFEVCLNNARWHPLSNGARKATEAYLEYKARGVFNQSSLTSPASLAVRASFASLINAHADEIAFVNSTTAGENQVVAALGLTRPATSGPQPNIVTDAMHFEGSLYLYGELKKRGVDVRIVKPRGWAIDKEDVERAVDKNTRLIAVSQVSWINGFTHDAKWLADLAHAHGAKLFLDAVQAAGCMPIDVRASGVDFIASASYKWLMGDFGLGFLFARADVLPTLERTQWSFRQFREMQYHALPGDAPGPFPATFDQLQTAAGHFEVGTYANAVLATLSDSLPWIQRIGVTNIQAHAHQLNSTLRREMPRLGYECITPEDAGASIISFRVKDDAATASRLKKANVDVSLNPGRMRVSPSVYNNESDIQALLSALA
ncbi:selenocysteine lyase [Terriglobus roseus DSM 18391]|uniref:Selenocysteine lyase n=1 Tax=Terriglobus roseus (strain DSM 18391 / NRRL B-41598 / KBS 63) TaxID=926566 RepID=I3ZLR9_TERRK|nr:aminotransferase class V-fold PLP-dependent enzyme [Terriglobus roseus]AFL90187.1 selenocysteine lyase [Terriglobus roseus DSM 18391]